MLDDRVAQFRGADVAVQLYGKFWCDRNAYFASYLNDAPPAFTSILAKSLPADECNVSMSQSMQMRQNQFCRKTVVEYQVGDAIDRKVSTDCHNRNWERMLQRRINGNKSFRAPAEEHSTVFFD